MPNRYHDSRSSIGTPAAVRIDRRTALGAVSGALLSSCGTRHADAGPAIDFTRIPQTDAGGKEKNDIIEGTVKGALPGQQVVLYARSGKWWLQPLVTNPFTRIKSNKWTNATHLGTEYAALLVDSTFRPPITYDVLPPRGAGVAAVAVVHGAASPPSVTIPFSGYEWRVRDAPSSRGGRNLYSPANVSTDAEGALHLRATKTGADWTCAEVSLTRSLGYGTYRFVVRDVFHLEPSLVFGMFTWDYAGGAQGNREMDIEITRWGDPSNQNAQYVVQPFDVAANVVRFAVPEGILTHTFRWEPGRVLFRTVRGVGGGSEGGPEGSHKGGTRSAMVAEHVFTSGIPSPGIESVRMNHYVFHSGAAVQASASEVVVERFEYLP